LDWEAIEDRTRNLCSLAYWESPFQIVNACAEQFRLNKWLSQSTLVEVWIEKDALLGVIEDVCNRLEVPFFSCRGYVSQSEMWQASQRFIRWENMGGDSVIVHLGDHDPFGIDMTRDIQERLALFGADTEVKRVALTMYQVREHDLPPNFAKESDTRHSFYKREYGSDSWELDALSPKVIAELIETEVLCFRDQETWDKMTVEEDDNRSQIEKFANQLE